jgi:hypothetical protein
VEQLNTHLQHDGYRLTRTGSMSGSPIYTIAAHAIGSPADAAISSALQQFEPEQIHGRWTAALDRRSTDPAGAITLARTLLEEVCRWLLEQLGETPSNQEDLPALYRRLAKALKLAPDDHSEQVFKQILGSSQQVVEQLGALRNRLGDAYGGGPKRARPAARHAELAVNLAAQWRLSSSRLGMLESQARPQKPGTDPFCSLRLATRGFQAVPCPRTIERTAAALSLFGIAVGTALKPPDANTRRESPGSGRRHIGNGITKNCTRHSGPLRARLLGFGQVDQD